MLKLLVDADQVSRYNIMDKILADYITRTIARLEAEKQKPVDTKENQYPVYPEDNESDTPKNPYSSA